MWTEDHLVIGGLQIEKMNDWFGTNAFGINGWKVAFGGFISNRLRSLGDFLRHNKTSTDAYAPFAKEEEVMMEKEETLLDKGKQMCLHANDEEARVMVCKNELGIDDTGKCVDSFCELCCFMFDKGVKAAKCAQECSQKTTKVGSTLSKELTIEKYFPKCFQFELTMSKDEKSEACTMCCKNGMTEFMEDSLLSVCNKECAARYPKQLNSDKGQIVDILMVKDPPPSFVAVEN